MNRDFPARHVINVIAPQLLDNAAAVSGWLSMADAVRLFALINIGATDITVDAKIQQATSAAGANAKDITGAALTQYTANDDNKYASIDLEAAALDINNGFYFVQLSITAGDGTAGAYASASIIRECRHLPATQPAAYKEKVVVAG